MKPFNRYKQAGMTRDEAKQEVAKRISCTRYLQKSKGKQYKCPFCGSGTGTHGTGALTYYPDTNTWTCFSCQKSGDVFDLIQQAQGVDFKTALDMGIEELGLTIASPQRPPESPESPKPAAEDKTPTEAAKEAGNATQGADYTAYYETCRDRLAESPAAVSYLAARGISLETAAACNIGFDPAADPAQSGHPAPRIIIPTTPAHYVGRSIDPETPASYQKLNNKGGTPGIFNTAALYGDAKAVFVVEGAFDALSVAEIGGAAIAVNSTSNGEKLLELIKNRKPAAKLIICYDNDTDPKTKEKTQAAAAALKTGLKALGVDSMIFNIAGEYKDANEALKADREAFTAAVHTAEHEATEEATKDGLTAFLETIQSEAYKPYSTGLSFFDNLLGGGVIRQTLLLLLAPPAVGKTTLAQQIAEAMAKNGKPVIYLNLEMSAEQMLAKAISGRLARKRDSVKATALDVLQGYRWTPEQQQAITAELEAYRQEIYPYLQYNPAGIGSSLDAIKQYLETAGQQAKAGGKEAPVIILDYLHLVTGNLDVQELLKQTVTALKGYAIKYNTFTIGIVATNRETNKGGKITMESGRDSSNLEYTADYQISLNYYAIDQGTIKTKELDKIAQLQQEPWRQMIIRVLKGRLVPPGKSARVYFHAAGNTFYGANEWLPPDDQRVPFGRELPPEKTENIISLRKH